MRKRVVLVRVADLDAKPRWSTTDDIIHVAIPPGDLPSGVLAFGSGWVSIWRIGDAAPLRTITGQIENADYGSPPVAFSPDGAFAVFRLNRELTIVRMSDGTPILVPSGSVDTENGIPVPVRVDFAVGTSGAVAYTILTDGEESTFIPDVPLQHMTLGRTAFWPGGGGPAIAEAWDDAFGLPHVAVGGFSDVLFGPVVDPWLGVVRFGSEPDAAVPQPGRAGLVVFRDGTTVELRMSVASVDFAPDSTTSALVVRYTDERSEIWDAELRRTIGILGLGVGANVFDASGDRLAVRYLSGDVYLVDVDRLRGLPVAFRDGPDETVISLACEALGASASSLAPTACG